VIRHLIDRIRGIWSRKLPEPSPEEDMKSEYIEIPDIDGPLLDDPFAKIVLNIDEEGDFALAVDFQRFEGKLNAEISAYVIHMINSGQMAEFFVQALNLWAEDVEQKRFALSVIKKWRDLYTEDDNTPEQQTLAVDPSEVFGMRKVSK